MKNSTPLKTSLAVAAALAVLLQISACSKPQDSSPAKTAVPAVEQAAPAPVNIRVSRETPSNAAPLGLEIAYANLAGVKKPWRAWFLGKQAAMISSHSRRTVRVAGLMA